MKTVRTTIQRIIKINPIKNLTKVLAPHKKLTALLLIAGAAISLTFALLPTAHASQKPISVKVDGVLIDFPDSKPFVENGRVLVPVRFVSEALGAEVAWTDNKEGGKVTEIFKDDKRIALVTGRNHAVLAVPEQVVKFFGGSCHNQKRKHYSNLRKKLGKKKLLKKIKAIGNKEQRYMKDVNHKLSRQIVNIAKEHNAVIHMENLSNIREHIKYSRRLNRQLHNWNFYQLQTFIQYKAVAEGLKITHIKPENTSRKCHVCGHIEKGNRPNQSTFKCKACGYQANADYNASVNIANHTVAG